MLHSFFILYRHAEAHTTKAASMHGATLVVFVGFVGVVNIGWILSVYSAVGTGSTGAVGEGGGGAVEGGRGGGSLMGLGGYDPPAHVKMMQVMCSVLGVCSAAGMGRAGKETCL
jgi:hypothetical protein